jgi:hypothetical protein
MLCCACIRRAQYFLLAEAGEMTNYLIAIPQLCTRAWRGVCHAFCVLYPAGREAIITRAKARTELEILAVEQKRLEIDTQRANTVIDLAQKVEKIKDAQLREAAKAAIIFRAGIALPTRDDAVA